MRKILAALLQVSAAMLVAGVAGPALAGLVTTSGRSGYPATTVMTDPDGTVSLKQIHDREDPSFKAPPPPKITTAPGELTYVARQPNVYTAKPIRVEGVQLIKRAPPNAGTVNPKALVAAVSNGLLNMTVALDSKEPDSPEFDILRVDFTGKGDFKNATIIRRQMVELHPKTKAVHYQFCEDPIEVTIGQRKYGLSFSCVYTEQEDTPTAKAMRRLVFSIGTMAQGVCQFGDKAHNIRLLDGDGTLRVNDLFTRTGLAAVTNEDNPSPLGVGDRVFVDTSDGEFRQEIGGFYGHPVLVDGRLWNLTVSPDGATVSAKPYAGETGMIHINHVAWQASFVGDSHIVQVGGGQDPVPIPPDRYQMREYMEWDSADWQQGERQWLHWGEPWQSMPVKVERGKTTEVVVGSPLHATITTTAARAGGYLIETHEWDASGAVAWITTGPGHLRKTCPTFNISDDAGKAVATFKSKPTVFIGIGASYWWKVPSDLKGVFKITADYTGSEFPAEGEEATFAIGVPLPPATAIKKPAPSRATPTAAKAPAGAAAASSAATSSASGSSAAGDPAASGTSTWDTGPKVPPVKAAPPDPEKMAQDKLKLAEMYEGKGLMDAATREYRRLIEQYPGTKAAETATQRLNKPNP